MFAVAMEENRMDEFFEAAMSLYEILRDNEDFSKLMNHPRIVKEDKVKIVEDTFGEKLPKELVGLMTLMVEKGRNNDMLSVLDYFIALVKEEKKIGKADVTTAVALSEVQKKKVEEKLLETTKYETFEMCYHVDETLIGGMVLRIGDRIVDSSIKTKLSHLSRQLKSIKI